MQTLDGAVFDAVVFAEREGACWLAGSDNFSRTQDFDGPPETEADRDPVHLAIVYDADGTITGYRNGQPYGKPYRADRRSPSRRARRRWSSACDTVRRAETGCSPARSIVPNSTIGPFRPTRSQRRPASLATMSPRPHGREAIARGASPSGPSC